MKRKKSLIAIISLSAFLVIGGAVAYYNSTTNVDNKLKTGQFKSEVVEKFTPKDNWEPGDKVTKEVGVENTGTGNIVSRAMWSETWKTPGTVNIPRRNQYFFRIFRHIRRFQ